MNRRFFFVLPMLMGIGLFVGGCSSTGSSLLSYDPNKPRTFLPGAEVEQAKSLAMGSAVTKGWKVVDSSDNRMVVKRPLDATAAQSVTGEPVSTASVEVESQFFKRQDGVDVVVGASLIANKGLKTERKINFTDSYKDDLNRSLNSLRRSWDENRWRVASATPPLPTKVAVAEDEDAASPATGFSDAQVADSGAELTPDAGSAVTPTALPSSAPVPVAAAPAAAAVAPVEDRTAGAVPPPVAASSAPAGPANNMLTLNRQAEPGVWAYYAEHYAKIRGCELSGNGTTLEQKQPEYEIHRVNCDNEKTFLVKCNAGTCRGME